MRRNSKSWILYGAALGSLLGPVALVLVAGAGHAGTEPFAPRAVVVDITPTPNCATDSPNVGNHNTGYGDIGNENSGNCVRGNGNRGNNVNGNVNGPTPSSCPDDDGDSDC
jgi:hypothetical protein